MVEDVELSIQGEVALLQLRRPDHGNALRSATFDQLRKLVLRLSDAPPQFVVLAGEGGDFCVGLERDPSDPLWSMFEPMVRNRDAHRAQELVVRLRSVFDALGRLPCPVVAAIEGRCHGVGLELALAADLRITSSSATLGLTEGQRGVLSGLGGLGRVSVLLGTARAAEMALLGQSFAADEALRIGLVNRVVPEAGALSAALETVAALRRLSPAARLQTTLALRAISARLAQDLAEAETQAAARAWIASDWKAALGSDKGPSW